ncbi:MAG: hypothetical protein BWY78_00507 [Alphaproteobacteria bacterium ADurb.Bin438]|nr:MAG: hypothetical protein BWY78_00507 [Alphaproteobacteria bacterium ADurb.Bin438]
MKYILILSLIFSFPCLAQDASLEADAKAIQSSYHSREQITKGVVGKSSNAFDDVLKSVSEGISNTVDNVKEAAAPVINKASETLGLDVKVETPADVQNVTPQAPPKPKDPLDISLEDVSLKSSIAFDMNKTLPPVSDKMAEEVISSLPYNVLGIKDNAKKIVDKNSNTFTITSQHSDNVNSYNLLIKRDLNFSVVNTIFFNGIFFMENSPLGLKGLSGEAYYNNDCKEGVISGKLLMVCYNKERFITYVTMAMTPSSYIAFSVSGKNSMKIAKDYVFSINKDKLIKILGETKASNIEYAEEINKIFKETKAKIKEQEELAKKQANIVNQPSNTK